MEIVIKALDATLHDRKRFDCGVEALNIFLKQYAKQNHIKNISKTYVAVDEYDRKKIYGYYTLSAGHIQCDELPQEVKSKLPKYPIPIGRIGRLAVDENHKGNGIGSFLLHDALMNLLAIAKKIGLFAVVVDAKNDHAKAFYQKYGFTELQDELTLFLPIETIQLAEISSMSLSA